MSAAASPGVALRPLLARYSHWLTMDEDEVLADRDEAAQDVWAIQIVLHLPKGEPAPSWHTALALSASGCAALCLDPRAEPGGDWYVPVRRYCAGHIRKVTRRARGAQWESTAALAGRTSHHGGTAIRVLVPGLVDDVPPEVRKLQVGGTDLPVDDEPVVVRAGASREGSRSQGAPVLVVSVPGGDTAPAMSAGKLMAQTGHAGMLAAALLAAGDGAALGAWHADGCPTRVARADAASWRDLLAAARDPRTAWTEHGLVAVRDAGFTEIAPGTVTAIARFER